jgi:hypothetical protein
MCVFAARLNGRIREVPITAIYNDKTSGVHPIYDTVRFFRAIFRSIVAIPRLDAARQVGNDRIPLPV